jgi:hypothetical protein
VFKDFVRLCIKLNLYSKELIAIDGNKFKTDNSKDQKFTKNKLADKIARLDAKIDEITKEMNAHDTEEMPEENTKTQQEIKTILAELNTRKMVYQRYAQELEQTSKTQKSLTDPDSRLMMANGTTNVSYNVQTAVDAKHKLIVDFEITNNAQDKNQLSVMTKKSTKILGVDKLTAVADASYDSAADIVNCLEDGVVAHVVGAEIDVCVPTSKEEAQEVLSYENGCCVYLAERNVAICLMGKVLYLSFYRKSVGEVCFRNSVVCKTCVCKCTKEKCKMFGLIMQCDGFRKVYDDVDLYVK